MPRSKTPKTEAPITTVEEVADTLCREYQMSRFDFTPADRLEDREPGDGCLLLGCRMLPAGLREQIVNTILDFAAKRELLVNEERLPRNAPT
jgi:hypothetical protein